MLHKSDIACFKRGETDPPKFWWRLDGKPSFIGAHGARRQRFGPVARGNGVWHRLPFLAEYVTHKVNCTLEKRREDPVENSFVDGGQTLADDSIPHEMF
jgi:hypothetical protein